jgi:hypothetical protein
MALRPLSTIAAVVSLGAMALGSITAQAQASYLTDLGAVAPGLGINNSGQVVLAKYFYGNGTLTAFPANFTGSGINSSGQVVGAATPPPSTCPNQSTFGVTPCIAVWASGTLTVYPGYLGFPDYVGNFGLSINSTGQIVGNWHATEVHDYTGAILFSNGVFSNLEFPYPPGGACSIFNPSTTFGPPNYAFAINDSGQIAGEMPRLNVDQTSQSCNEAFFYSQGTYTDIGPGAALALNATGQVVGALFSQPTVAHAFLYDPSGGGPARELGALPGGSSSYAYSINAAGLIVGASSTAPLGFPLDPSQLDYPVLSSYEPSSSLTGLTAFLYDGVMMDLNTFVSVNDPLKLFVTLTEARGINDSGLVIVNGVDSRDKSNHAYLLQVPLIQVTPGPLSFPGESNGSQSPPQTATFTNAGTTSIALGAALVSSGFVIQSNTCGAALGPAAQCAIAVVFAPTGTASPSGTLTLPAAGVPIAVPLLSALSASITASSTAVTTATGVTLTWTATPGTTCTATGGSAADGWVGSVPVSGSRSVKEPGPGTYTYGISCTAGPQSQIAQAAPVAVTWAPVTVTITASPTTLHTGQLTTLTWSAQNATTCASSGGGSNDGWPNSTRATSGSATITEPNPVITGGSETLTFTLSCTSSASSLSAKSSVNVVQLATPPPAGGGGGGIDPWTLLGLAGFLLLRRRTTHYAAPSFG